MARCYFRRIVTNDKPINRARYIKFMSDTAIKKNDQIYGAIQLLSQTGEAPLPFTQEIFLLRCHIAGTSYRDLEEIEPLLQENESFTLRREPHNPHDPHAIAIFDKRGSHLGYVPRNDNKVISRLLDAGKFIYAKLKTKRWCAEWLKLDIEIFLKEL